ncbi:hypothetical protein VOLCADRAFT_120960 [Volvox carteri f. nagariensis]|uniref:Beta-glucosidase n=1 Tax=Volvox carteri f. nagariensis TaxID=3068 RepID=D8TY50_VOLCA|nr:uncharacterized protein VOLCADRAFT_120960 [Volvox carteri f. nagariensis]EFJ47488.1 hypothetical protein VOLCADRAFT_120960 [Volvox carteri f. nagariensis]|eukprot:XP_002951312.1 hypothetical protein VOLCADRAFT_120960 [Volvox carteri f. nagariensis]
MPYGPGRVDEIAVQRYRDILDRCLEAGLEPMVTLHHFVHPQWFEALGGFEREENITLIATFNEPTCAAFTGHIVGVHAPGRRGAVRGAGLVLLHMLRAHSAAYRAIKQEPGGQEMRVGLVHQKIRFEAEGSGALSHASRWTADWLTHCFGWHLVHEYLATGRLGINYYTRVVLDWRLRFTCRPGEVLTDMGWPVVPEGLYDAIAHSAELGLPLYVTETGIADGRDDRRAPLIAAYWQQVARAVADGHDVRGFYYWTLCDNFEWHLGYNMKFGLFEWTEAPEHPQVNAAAAAAAAAAAVKTSSDVMTAVNEDDELDLFERVTELTPFRGTMGPSAAATATVTIISVSQPSSLPATTATGRSSAVALLSPVLDSDADRAVAEAEARARHWPGRRLRQGSLELVRRYAATPDELSAAWSSLAETVWPHVPLPAGLRRQVGGTALSPSWGPDVRHGGLGALHQSLRAAQAAVVVPLVKVLAGITRELAAVATSCKLVNASVITPERNTKA